MAVRDVRFVHHQPPDRRAVDVSVSLLLARARVSRSKKYARWHVSQSPGGKARVRQGIGRGGGAG